jgi:hypothetical protein
MSQLHSARKIDHTQPAVIESVEVSGRDGPRRDFRSGETAHIEIRVRALRDVSNLSIDVYLLDRQFYPAFNTSSDRLGAPLLRMKAGEVCTFRLEVDLHLAAGDFQLCAGLYRYDIGQVYDRIEPAVTLLINTTKDVQGIVNLHPRIIACDT